MFILTHAEADNLKSQIVTSSWGGRRKLSSVLRSPRAVATNLSIMRAFVRYREALMMNAGLAEKFWQLEGKVDRHDKEIGGIMDAIRGMIEGPRKRKGEIGFRP